MNLLVTLKIVPPLTYYTQPNIHKVYKTAEEALDSRYGPLESFNSRLELRPAGVCFTGWDLTFYSVEDLSLDQIQIF